MKTTLKVDRSPSPRSIRVPGVVVLTASLFAWAGPATAASDTSPDTLAAKEVIRCVLIDGENFCTELGFVSVAPSSSTLTNYLKESRGVTSDDTGDLSLADTVNQLQKMTPEALELRQKEQISAARQSVGKVKLYDYLAAGTGLPDSFLNDYPELGFAGNVPIASSLRMEAAGSSRSSVESLGAGASAVTTVPYYSYIMTGKTREQERSYWCGPAAMQMLDWGDPNDDGLDSQSLWASLMGTTTAGTSISMMVREVNRSTDWDLFAGTYSVISVSANTQYWFRSVHRAQLGIYRAPVIEHVMLRTAYFPYINFNHGGHYQVGRGYTQNGDQISIYDPYDERDFRTGGAASAGEHTLPVSSLWNATLANSLQNIGA